MFAIKLSHIFFIFFLFFSFSLGVLVNIFNNKIIDFSILENNFGKPSVLLDDLGNEWAKFEVYKRGYTKFENFPKHLIQAFIAAEDRNFFEHSGLSFRGILRSMLVNLWYGKKVQGASTITQQLVRLLFFDSKKTFTRKFKEQFFAILVENQFSKEQILEMYLNHLYLGCGIYGVEAASQRFFGKSIKEISIAESATIAAIVKSPANYCPLLAQASAQKRRDLILSLMKDMNFITKEEYEKEKSTDQKLIKINNNNDMAVHLKETLRIFLEKQFGKKKLYTGGLKIQTTINLQIQEIAQKEFIKKFSQLKKDLKNNVDGALTCMDSKTGEIKAMIGGFDFVSSKFNRALQAKRQMGSTFKPIVYACALEEEKINFTDTEIDEPIEILVGNQKWSPNNNTRCFEGKMTFAKALSYSNNTIAVKTLLKVGTDKFVKFAKKFKFSTTLNPYPSLALGCVEATLKESVGAFNVFANNGTWIEPHFIKWIKDEYGTKIYKVTPDTEKIIDSKISDQVAKILSISIKRYLDRLENNTFKCESIGKTGTTNDSRTCWYCGSTPNYTTAVYIGCDDNQSMGQNIYAVRTVFPIWLAINEQIKQEKKTFSYDPSLKETTIDWVTGEKCEDQNNSNIISILTTSV